MSNLLNRFEAVGDGDGDGDAADGDEEESMFLKGSLVSMTSSSPTGSSPDSTTSTSSQPLVRDVLVAQLEKSSPDFEAVLNIMKTYYKWSWNYTRGKLFKKHIHVPVEHRDSLIYLHSNYVEKGSALVNPIINEDYFFSKGAMLDYLKTMFGVQAENQYAVAGPAVDEVLPRAARTRALSSVGDDVSNVTTDLSVCSPVVASTAKKTWNLPNTALSNLSDTTQAGFMGSRNATSSNANASMSMDTNTANALLDLGLGNATVQTPLIAPSAPLSDVEKLRKISKNISFTENIDEMMYRDDQLIVGRERETELLVGKLEDGVRTCQGLVMGIHGQTSFGKTTIVRYAVDSIMRSRGTGVCTEVDGSSGSRATASKRRRIASAKKAERTAQVIWTTNSKQLLYQAQDKLHCMDESESLVFVIDEADLCCQLHTTADHVGGSGNINNKNFQDLKALIQMATADNSRLILLCIGNTCIFPDEMKHVDVRKAAGTNKFDDVEYLTLVKTGMQKDRLSSLLFGRYDISQLEQIICARLREFVDVTACKAPIQYLAKKAGNEISSTRYMLNVLDHLFTAKRKLALSIESQDTGSVTATGGIQESNPSLFTFTMNEMVHACGDMKSIPKADLMIQNQCTCCRYLMEAFDRDLLYGGCFSKRDICNSYYQYVQERKLPPPMDGCETSTSDILRCINDHMIPNGIMADGGNPPRFKKHRMSDVSSKLCICICICICLLV